MDNKHNTKFKILLVNPSKMDEKGVLDNLKYPPLGIVTLAGVLRDNGFEVFLLDANAEKKNQLKRILELISHEGINSVGISFTSNLAKGAYFYAEKIKERFPQILIIAGGYHPTVKKEEVVSWESIDYVVVGEGEITFPILLRAIEQGENVSNIKGICYKKDGKVVVTPSRPLIQDLDSIPIPAYDLLNLDNYGSLSAYKRPFLTMIRSRGCHYNCLFCGVEAMFSRRYRCQSPQRTVEEIGFIVGKFKAREIAFKDSDFLIDKDNVNKFCKLLISKGIDLVWSCSTRVDKVDKDILSLMKKAGCRQITFGIESGSQKMLNVLRKGTTVRQIIEAVKTTKEAGIECVAGFVLGTPGEDHQTIDETLKLLKKIDLDYVSFNFLTAFPGSDLYDLALKNGWFIDESYSAGYEKLNINASKLSEEELKKAMQIMIREFYFSPSYIWKRLKNIRINNIHNNLIGVKGLLSKLVKK